jgi:Zn-dependent protease
LLPYPVFANIGAVIGFLPLSFLAIATAFFCHEIAHKYTGQKFGYWSEFRMYPQGLLFALFLGLIAGIVFAAPGAVQIFGRPNKDEMGKISLAGPLTNIILGLIFLGVWYFSDGTLAIISYFIAYINVFLALFNLIPFGPFDGLKIFRWKKEVWGFLIGIDIILFILIL